MTPATDDHKALFWRDGFVVVPNVLTLDELETFGQAVDAGVAARTRYDTRTLQEKSLFEQQFIQCINLWEDCPNVRVWTFHPRVAQMAAFLLGVSAVRLFFDQALYKEPGGIGTKKHQDQTRWPIKESNTLTAWIPFEGSTLESGTIGYIPRSHLLGKSSYLDLFVGRSWNEASQHQLQENPVFVEVPCGAIAFHHGCTFHMAMPNRTVTRRRVFTMVYFQDGSTRGSIWPHPSVDRANIEVGAPIISEATPIVWPRPTDNLPTPPEPLRDPPFGWPSE